MGRTFGTVKRRAYTTKISRQRKNTGKKMGLVFPSMGPLSFAETWKLKRTKTHVRRSGLTTGVLGLTAGKKEMVTTKREPSHMIGVARQRNQTGCSSKRKRGRQSWTKLSSGIQKENASVVV